VFKFERLIWAAFGKDSIGVARPSSRAQDAMPGRMETALFADTDR
jgi:hypothetical protein